MIRLIAVSMIAFGYALTAAPAFAQKNKTSMERQSHAGAKAQKTKVKTSQQAVARASARGAYAHIGSPYSANPEYDVYLNGVYVGSDPDPRIRWTIQQEAKGSHNASR